jgi:hypothetical protein
MGYVSSELLSRMEASPEDFRFSSVPEMERLLKDSDLQSRFAARIGIGLGEVYAAAQQRYENERANARADMAVLKGQQNGSMSNQTFEGQLATQEEFIRQSGGFRPVLRVGGEAVVGTGVELYHEGILIADANKMEAETGLRYMGVTPPDWMTKDWSEEAQNTEADRRAGVSPRDQFSNRGREQAWRGAALGTGLVLGRVLPKFVPTAEAESAATKPIHGNSALSPRPATLYRLEDYSGNFLKWGITQNPATRYPASFLKYMRLVRVTEGPRSLMLQLERDLVETAPGPLNMEPWAGSRAP